MKSKIAQLISPPKKEKLHEAIVAQIKTLIHTKKLGVGDRLPSERELAQLFSVSRVVVRESLRSLEQSGLIEVRPGSSGGAFITYNVHKPLFDAAYDLFNKGNLSLSYFFEARRAIECFAVKLAAEKATAEDLQTLKNINKKLLQDIDDKAKLRENNSNFHAAVAKMSGNPLLLLMTQSLLQILDVVYPKSKQSDDYVKSTYDRHEGIIKAMEERSPERCEELMRIDVEYTSKLRFRGDDQG
ncbi:MAG: Pyruvate dehydrogenase complex repressor [Syntrophorhabdaceae bacterium PtaU1.Bin034]|jgi:DNA-binding FadR family transcriptional regulator|nr:MAG: Pyruvate dehydrogenase complex repressor [Syntrophorhabdaceae bacterium PtaU1.Bin034]